MTNRSKARGTAAETAVLRVLHAAGHEEARRIVLHGSADHGDIEMPTPAGNRLVIEVKSWDSTADQVSDAQLSAWLGELERERLNAGASVGLLVWRRRAVGPSNADRWYAATPGVPVPGGVILGRSGLGSFPVRFLLRDALHLIENGTW